MKKKETTHLSEHISHKKGTKVVKDNQKDIKNYT